MRVKPAYMSEEINSINFSSLLEKVISQLHVLDPLPPKGESDVNSPAVFHQNAGI